MSCDRIIWLVKRYFLLTLGDIKFIWAVYMSGFGLSPCSRFKHKINWDCIKYTCLNKQVKKKLRAKYSDNISCIMLWKTDIGWGYNKHNSIVNNCFIKKLATIVYLVNRWVVNLSFLFDKISQASFIKFRFVYPTCPLNIISNYSITV